MFSGRSYSTVVLNLLIAFAISMVVNFSYALLFLVEQQPDSFSRRTEYASDDVVAEGVLSLSVDGHGYLVGNNPTDSVYVTSSRAGRLGLADGDVLKVRVSLPGRVGAHMRFEELLERNGEPFDYATVYARPKESSVFALQILYFLVFAFVMTSLMTRPGRNGKPAGYWRRLLLCVAVAVPLYFAAPVTEWRKSAITIVSLSEHLLDYNMILKCSFALVVSLLYARIYQLMRHQQEIVLENEHLKNENLSTRYNMLVSQINPHFFFNSLNSLSMLVRDNDCDKALTYIDQLSYTFRYIIQNGQNTLSTLGEELQFADAYSYLFRIRYADKLFFDIEADEHLKEYRLPALTLQPLIGNAVKHNTITKSKPFRVSIHTEDEYIVVSNPRIPKLEPEPGTGIGLKNLDDRCRLITGHGIEVYETETEFTVKVPLVKPETK